MGAGIASKARPPASIGDSKASPRKEARSSDFMHDAEDAGDARKSTMSKLEPTNTAYVESSAKGSGRVLANVT